MTPKEILQKVLDKAITQGWKFGSNDFKVDIKDRQVGFWEGGHFYTLKDMVTMNGVMHAIFGEKTIALKNGESILAKMYYRQRLLGEDSWEIIGKWLNE